MAFTYVENMEALAFTSGSTEPQAAETLTGATSGATAVVVSVTVDSGSWAGGDAAGTVYVKDRSGTFQAEAVNGSVGGSDILTSSGATSGGFNSLNYMRLLLDDTDSSYPLFTDNEINGWVSYYTTDDGVVQYEKAASVMLRALAVDVDRLSMLADRLGGAMRLDMLMDMCWKRAEALSG